jgi:hypothetical protein
MTDKPYVYNLDDPAEDELAAHAAKVVRLEAENGLYASAVKTPSTAELLAGGSFRGLDPLSDAAWWSINLQQHDSHARAKLPRSVMSALRDVSAAPDRYRLARLLKLSKVRRPEWHPAYIESLREIEDRCTVYLAILGDTNAQLKRTELAFRYFDPKSPTPVNCDLLIRAISGATSIHYQDVVETVIPALTVHSQVMSMVIGMTDLRKWVAGRKKALEERDAAREQVVIDDALAADVADSLDERWSAPARSRGLVVVPSLDHLPKPSTVARDRRDTARSEFESIAGKELPLKRCERDIALVAIEMSRRFAWMTEALDVISMHVAMSHAGIKLPPLMLAGPPGTGKTTAAVAFCEALGLPSTVYSVAGVADGAFQGTSRQYSTGRACVPLQTILLSGVANPVIILDEAEKAATGKHNGSINDIILSMTEPVSASRFFDPYLECAVDLSATSFLATVNRPELLSGALRDRFRILHVPEPQAEHVPSIVAGMLADLRKARGVTQEFLPDLAPDEVALLVDRWKPGSMRGLRRTVETILATRDRLATRN